MIKILKDYLKNEIESLTKEVSVALEKEYYHSSLSRLNREIYYAEHFQVEEELIALHKLSIYLKENNIPYFLQGNTSNLYMLYLLGISRVNPLDFNLRYENFFGLELEKTKLRASQLFINMAVPTECHSAVLDKIKSEQMLKNKKTETRKYSFNIGKISIAHFDMPCEIKDYFSETDFNILLEFILEEYNDDDFANAIDTVFDCKSDITLDDAIKVFGLIHSSWNFDDILIAFSQLDMPLSDVPVFYDDVFDMLLNNFTNKDAWKYADSVHWGNDLSQEVARYVPPAIFNWCNSALYLFPKAHALEHFIHQYKLKGR